VLAGFENHAGRTHLGSRAQPLGRVLRGHGNNGSDAHEGAREETVIGTYMHGPLLPKNAWFADWLITTAIGDGAELEPLADELEQQAHEDACKAAGL
jgi:CobQ-like glutamine amidotransferase family enzyme